MAGSALVEIVILALVACFVALRFVSVLGKRTGHEQPIGQQPRDPASPRPVGVPRPIDAPAQPGAPIVFSDADVDPDAADGLRAIIAADPDFDPARFLEGAKAAYNVVLEAFWAGDRETLKNLVDDEVLADFEAAIDARATEQVTLENSIARIERARIVGASINAMTASLSVRFDADIVAVTRDRDGRVIAGSLEDAVETHDVWTFARQARSDDPNWLLIATDEAA
jgi:predicted lipid-binding transport protein (Tim44 family)